MSIEDCHHRILELVEGPDIYDNLTYQCKDCGKYISNTLYDFTVYSDQDGN